MNNSTCVEHQHPLLPGSHALLSSCFSNMSTVSSRMRAPLVLPKSYPMAPLAGAKRNSISTTPFSTGIFFAANSHLGGGKLPSSNS